MDEKTSNVKVKIPSKVSLMDKIKACYSIFRYGNDYIRFWRNITCGYCGSRMILPIDGKQYRTESSNSEVHQKIYLNSYVCASCGAIGTEDQYWYQRETEK